MRSSPIKGCNLFYLSKNASLAKKLKEEMKMRKQKCDSQIARLQARLAKLKSKELLLKKRLGNSEKHLNMIKNDCKFNIKDLENQLKQNIE